MDRTEICNRALAVLGHDRTVADLDGVDGETGEFVDKSTEAYRCRLFFGDALLHCLSAHDWDFAAVEVRVAPACAGPDGFARVPLPGDCLRVCGVRDADGRPAECRRAGDVLRVRLRGRGAAVLRYVSSDVDVAELPFRFRDALVHRLAAMLCGPMYGSDSKTQSYETLARAKASEAIAAEADETAYMGEPENPFLAARR